MVELDLAYALDSEPLDLMTSNSLAFSFFSSAFSYLPVITTNVTGSGVCKCRASVELKNLLN